MAQMSFANVLKRPEASGQENHTPAVEQEAVADSFVCLCLSRKGRLTDIPEHERRRAGTRLRRHGNSITSASRVGFSLASV